MNREYKIYNESNFQSIPHKGATNKGKYFQCVPHKEAIQTLMNCLDGAKWRYKGVEILLNPSGNNVEFSCQVNPFVGEWNKDQSICSYDLFLCMRCSHSGRYASRIFLGVILPDEDGKPSIRIPTFSFFLGKNTAKMATELKGTIQSGLRFLEDVVGLLELSRLDIPLTQEQSFSIVNQAADAKLMPWSRIGKWYDSYNKGNRHTAWRLLVSFCETIQNNPPLKQIEESYKLYCLVSDTI